MVKQKRSSSPSSVSSTKRPSSALLPSIVSQEKVSYTYVPELPVYFQFFENDLFISMLKEQINTTYKVQIEYMKDLVENRLILTGPQQYVEAASKEIHNLFKLIRTKIYDNELLYTWAFIPSVINILQSHLISVRFMVACEFTADDNLCIHYFDKQSRYGTKESTLDQHIPDDFALESIILTKKTSKHLLHEIDTLCKESISTDSIYIERIESHLTLFATKPNLEKMKKRIDELINNHHHGIFTMPVTNLKPRCLLITSRHLLETIEKDYIDDEIVIISLIGEDKFRAPAYLQSTIEQRINTLLSQLVTTSFKIENVNFASKNDFDSQLENITEQHNCYFETSIKVKESLITIANAFASPKSNTPLSIITKDEALRSSNITFQRATLSTGSIELHTGDPSTQNVDIIIISSVVSSIRDAILDCAGIKTRTEFENALNRNEQPIITDGGNLPCKKIIFVNFPALQSDSMKTIVFRYIKYSIKHFGIKCQSIAFLMGEGGLNIDGFNQTIFDNVKELFEKKQLQIKLLFILPPERSDLLKIIQSYQTKEDGYAKLRYTRTTFRITLVSSNRENLAACEKSIQTSTKQITTTKQDKIKLWDQYTINAYYKFCIDYFVLPNFNFDLESIELTGTVDAVTNAEFLFDLEMERITRPSSLSIVKKLEITEEQKRSHQALLEKQIQIDSQENSEAKINAEKALRKALKEHGKDVGDRLLFLQRWIRKYPRVTIKNIPPLSPTGDFNDAPFILPADIAANPAKYLQPWLTDWVPMDLSGVPSDLSRRIPVFSDSLTQNECHDCFSKICAAERTNYLNTSIEENKPAWSAIEGNIDDGGLRSEEELQKRAVLEDPVKMTERREKLDEYFISKSRATEEQLAPYQHFAYRIAANTTEFDRICREFKT